MKTENSIHTSKEMSWEFKPVLVEPSLSRENRWQTLLDEALDRVCSNGNVSLKEFIDELERRLIIQTLFRANGNRREASELLGIKYTTLHEKLKKHNIRFKNIAY
jgi:DNA-binding NtrC family response regulator